VGGAVLVVATRIALWLGVQLGLAGLLILVGAAPLGQALDEAAGWWMVYLALIDLGTLGVIFWLLKREGGSYRRLLGPPTTAWQVALGAAGVLAASVPAVAFSAQLTSARYGDGSIAPMFAVVDLPPWASVLSVLVVPLLAELAEPVAYLGVVLPRLERRLGRSWLAATVVVAVWAGEHALYPLLVSGGGLDWGFAAYRVGSVLPFLAAWTALYYALGRRLLPVMAARWVFNAGTALALALGLVA
jgi:membrane protease YdiL (CAAX protease family)